MKKLVISLAVFLMVFAAEVNAAIITVDFSALPDGEIPAEGYDVGPVHISNGDVDRPVSIGGGRMYFLSGRSAIFDFSVPVSQIWATIGSNYCTMSVTAYGTLGDDGFSTYSPWEPGISDTINEIGNIYRVEAMGYESWMGDFQYDAVPLPATVWLLGSGLMGLLGLRRKIAN